MNHSTECSRRAASFPLKCSAAETLRVLSPAASSCTNKSHKHSFMVEWLKTAVTVMCELCVHGRGLNHAVPLVCAAAGLPVTAVVTATALSSTIASLICGLGANLPVGLSPGMGLNAYLVFSQVRGRWGPRGGWGMLVWQAEMALARVCVCVCVCVSECVSSS
jgi:hypothetical protein